MAKAALLANSTANLAETTTQILLIPTSRAAEPVERGSNPEENPTAASTEEELLATASSEDELLVADSDEDELLEADPPEDEDPADLRNPQPTPTTISKDFNQQTVDALHSSPQTILDRTHCCVFDIFNFPGPPRKRLNATSPTYLPPINIAAIPETLPPKPPDTALGHFDRGAVLDIRCSLQVKDANHTTWMRYGVLGRLSPFAR
eukprot:TRINITY_DN3852_c0_g1_i10.p1 TRINITY_DN3852_c0_g1~~TRINITY_DN3852_c0_g1_i10.p1  ORF type:complete len:218 (-),score=34.67 TRINITY_DN3852_c0_g1_i10:1746-2363(-)